MVNIRFVERSLLFGYSFLGFTLLIVRPCTWIPNLNTTKNRHCLLLIPYFEDILNGKRWDWTRRRIGFYAAGVFKLVYLARVVLYLVYLFLLVALSMETHKKFLESFDITREYELSYKALYYTPLLNRLFMFVVEVFSVVIWRNNEWLLLDKYAIFSLCDGTQFKFVLITLAVGLPDAYFDHFEITTYLKFDTKNRYFLVGLLHYTKPVYDGQPLPYHLIGILMFLFVFLNKVVRYRSLLTVIYSALSVRRHLKVINNQIIMNEPKGNAPMKSTEPDYLENPTPDDANYSASSRPTSTSLARKVAAHHALGNVVDYRPVQANDWMTQQSSEPPIHYQNLLIHHSTAPPPPPSSSFDTHSSSSRASSRSKIQVILEETQSSGSGSSASSGSNNNNNICVITNLRQLEQHLARLEFFVSDIDQSAATLVFSMCLISQVQFICSIFFLIELQSSYTSLLLGFIFCASRLLPPFFLFLTGSAMEQEAKRLLAELECIYLQDSTQCLIYKQYSSTISSLTRIIRQLESIKFDCDRLMRINFGTMKQMIVYTIAILFFVVQYDALNVLYDRSGLASNSTSSVATTSSNSINNISSFS